MGFPICGAAVRLLLPQSSAPPDRRHRRQQPLLPPSPPPPPPPSPPASENPASKLSKAPASKAPKSTPPKSKLPVSKSPSNPKPTRYRRNRCRNRCHRCRRCRSAHRRGRAPCVMRPQLVDQQDRAAGRGDQRRRLGRVAVEILRDRARVCASAPSRRSLFRFARRGAGEAGDREDSPRIRVGARLGEPARDQRRTDVVLREAEQAFCRIRVGTARRRPSSARAARRRAPPGPATRRPAAELCGRFGATRRCGMCRVRIRPGPVLGLDAQHPLRQQAP